MTSRAISELTTIIENRAEQIAELIHKAVQANMEHHRPASVNLIVKIARNADDPRLIEVTAQEKIKAPKSKFSDLTSWDEVDCIRTYKLGEDAGQEFLPGTEDSKLMKAAIKLDKDLKKSGTSMTISTPDGRNATIGKKK